MLIKWSGKYKKKWGWSNARELYIKEMECLKKSCFHPYDWNYDGHLVCLTNAKHGCPRKEIIK